MSGLRFWTGSSSGAPPVGLRRLPARRRVVGPRCADRELARPSRAARAPRFVFAAESVRWARTQRGQRPWPDHAVGRESAVGLEAADCRVRDRPEQPVHRARAVAEPVQLALHLADPLGATRAPEAAASGEQPLLLPDTGTKLSKRPRADRAVDHESAVSLEAADRRIRHSARTARQPRLRRGRAGSACAAPRRPARRLPERNPDPSATGPADQPAGRSVPLAPPSEPAGASAAAAGAISSASSATKPQIAGRHASRALVFSLMILPSKNRVDGYAAGRTRPAAD